MIKVKTMTKVKDIKYTITEEDLKSFEKHLATQEKSKNTIAVYMFSVNLFYKKFGTITKNTLMAYKAHLSENKGATTVNLRLQAINSFLIFKDFDPRLKIKFVKIQQKSFLENVISISDYNFLKNRLKEDNKMKDYFMVWCLGATGARVSELIQLKTENFEDGYLDVISKGDKYRRLWLPKTLCKEIRKWIKENGIRGYVFQNKFGERITTRGIAGQLKYFAKKYGLNPKVVYPHSFRHMFAKEFLKKLNDLVFLADLMGHENLETTRIYLRKTAEEQRALIDRIIKW